MPIDLYYVPASSPCRAVRLAAKLVGIDVNLKLMNLQEKEHLKPEFLKMNPQHTVPTIDDNGFYIYESRAIITYLFNKYGQDDSLYPKDPQKRGIVDQMMYFDIGLFQRFADYYRPAMLSGASFDPERLKKVEETLGLFDNMLDRSEFAAGNYVTLADVTLVATISSIDALDVINLGKLFNVSRWFAKCKKVLPDYEELVGFGAIVFKDRVQMKVEFWRGQKKN